MGRMVRLGARGGGKREKLNIVSAELGKGKARWDGLAWYEWETERERNRGSQFIGCMHHHASCCFVGLFARSCTATSATKVGNLASSSSPPPRTPHPFAVGLGLLLCTPPAEHAYGALGLCLESLSPSTRVSVGYVGWMGVCVLGMPFVAGLAGVGRRAQARRGRQGKRGEEHGGCLRCDGRRWRLGKALQQRGQAMVWRNEMRDDLGSARGGEVRGGGAEWPGLCMCTVACSDGYTTQPFFFSLLLLCAYQAAPLAGDRDMSMGGQDHPGGIVMAATFVGRRSTHHARPLTIRPLASSFLPFFLFFPLSFLVPPPFPFISLPRIYPASPPPPPPPPPPYLSTIAPSSPSASPHHLHLYHPLPDSWFLSLVVRLPLSLQQCPPSGSMISDV
ncbi:hypothetical protein B0O80DRAFT_179045 [Mortierella sp. GBAus27b]|nr:hypothetical protein B0O80DRAFT_179045 [Mortierella sp. GBAus27b]